MKEIKENGKNFLTDVNNMLYVETNLYGVNLQDYFRTLFEHKENPDNIDPDEEEIESATRIINKRRKILFRLVVIVLVFNQLVVN